ncbi:MAG: HAD-IC family P-type ATPase [Hyphomicrobiaceae bacterium]
MGLPIGINMAPLPDLSTFERSSRQIGFPPLLLALMLVKPAVCGAVHHPFEEVRLPAAERRSGRPMNMARDALVDMAKPAAAPAVPLGLTTAEARRRLAEHGPNTVREEAPSGARRFLAKLWGPIPWMLEAAIALQLALGVCVEAAVIAALLLFNAILGFVQEGRATAALTALKKRLAPTPLVRRDGAWGRLPAAEVVPGDAIRLPLGSLVPADATIVSGSVLVDQSMLTGESVPVEGDLGGLVYAGSLVRRGQAVAEVTATGARTYFGRADELVRTARAASTEQAAIFSATRNLAVVNGIIAISIVAYAYVIALPTADLFRLGLTALLATIPVALPATFTPSAALAGQVLVRRGVLLTRLSAAHEAAAMDLLCADKTGTLTRNTLQVADVVPMPAFDRDRVRALAALASSEADQDPIDVAIRAAAGPSETAATGRLVRFIPFDPASRTAEAFAADREGRELRVVKGAFEAIDWVAEVPADARSRVDTLAAQGHRVIAVAAGPPQALRLVGLIALSDPPSEDSAGLIAALGDMHVRTIMVTGDSAVTAAAIARKVGISGGVAPTERLASVMAVNPTAVAPSCLEAGKDEVGDDEEFVGHPHAGGGAAATKCSNNISAASRATSGAVMTSWIS